MKEWRNLSFNSLCWVPTLPMNVASMTLSTFNSLCWVLPNIYPERRWVWWLSIPFVGFKDKKVYYYLKTLDFQFPLLGSKSHLYIQTLRRCFFQFPLLGSRKLSFFEVSFSLSTFNSLCWVRNLYYSTFQTGIICFQFPLLGSAKHIIF